MPQAVRAVILKEIGDLQQDLDASKSKAAWLEDELRRLRGSEEPPRKATFERT